MTIDFTIDDAISEAERRVIDAKNREWVGSYIEAKILLNTLKKIKTEEAVEI